MVVPEQLPSWRSRSRRARSDGRSDAAGTLALYSGFAIGGTLYAFVYRRALLGDYNFMHELFWLATIVIVGTVVAILWWRKPSRRECLVLSALVGLSLFLPKLFRSPDYFNFFDELGHWRATDGLLRGAGLFQSNPLNPVVQYYPGLHAATAALAAATGLSIYAAGNVLIATAHVLVCAALFIVADRLVASSRLAVVAVLLYATTAGFFYFDAQFAYESLALPLVFLTVLMVMSLEDHEDVAPRVAVAALMIVAVVVTHHASSYMLVLLLVVLATVRILRRRRRRAGRADVLRATIGLAAFAIVATALWLVAVAPFTFTYLGPLIRANLTSLPQFFGGTTKTRTLFLGADVPRYEIWCGYASVLVLLGLLAVAARRWRAKPRVSNPWLWAMALVSLGYIASLPLVLLRADQVAKRSWTFTYLGVAVLAAPVLGALLLAPARARRIGGLVLLLVLFVGGVVSRSGVNIRFPGPYQPSSDPRAMTRDVIVAARWMGAAEGSGNGMMGDRTIAAVFGAYGRQNPRQEAFKGYLAADVFMRPRLDHFVASELARTDTRFLVEDLRVIGRPPLTGFYFDRNEYGAFSGRATISRRGLTKFDGPGFDRIYDNGNIVIYQKGNAKKGTAK